MEDADTVHVWGRSGGFGGCEPRWTHASWGASGQIALEPDADLPASLDPDALFRGTELWCATGCEIELPLRDREAELVVHVSENGLVFVRMVTEGAAGEEVAL